MGDRRLPGGVDVNRPNVARIYDYMLGGKDNFAADREAAEQVLKVFPEARDGVRYNREFLGNSVRYLVQEAGIRQFVDIGAGLPAQSNVHEVAQSVAPDTRTVYVDNDPVACVHGRAILANSSTVAMLDGDLRDPEKIIGGAAETGLIDWSQPVGVLMVAILHFLPDPYDEVALIREHMAPGSHLVISHLSMTESSRSKDVEQMKGVFARTSTGGLFPRTADDITRFLGDFEVLDPALFYTDVPQKFLPLGWGGVGRKMVP